MPLSRKNLLQAQHDLVSPQVDLDHLRYLHFLLCPLPLAPDLPHVLRQHQLGSCHPLPPVTTHQQVAKVSLQLQHHLREGSLSHYLLLGFRQRLEKWEWHRLLVHFPGLNCKRRQLRLIKSKKYQQTCQLNYIKLLKRGGLH